MFYPRLPLGEHVPGIGPRVTTVGIELSSAVVENVEGLYIQHFNCDKRDFTAISEYACDGNS